MKLRILTCGGTIDKVYFDANSAYQVGDAQIEAMLREGNVALEYEVQSILRKDSLEMTDADRQFVRATIAALTESRVLVTHGTDTMVETARVVADLAGKTIVFTGAMQPAKLRVSDAAFNIGFALAAVQLLPAGTWIAMNGRVSDPRATYKNLAAGRFDPINKEAD